MFLGAVTAAAGPFVASLGDYFPGNERGRVYGFILAGELLGAGFGFAVTGDIAALSWRAAFVVLFSRSRSSTTAPAPGPRHDREPDRRCPIGKGAVSQAR